MFRLKCNWTFLWAKTHRRNVGMFVLLLCFGGCLFNLFKIKKYYIVLAVNQICLAFILSSWAKDTMLWDVHDQPILELAGEHVQRTFRSNEKCCLKARCWTNRLIESSEGREQQVAMSRDFCGNWLGEYKRAADTRWNEVEIGLGSRVAGCHTKFYNLKRRREEQTTRWSKNLNWGKRGSSR
jgi:hypothetical protein